METTRTTVETTAGSAERQEGDESALQRAEEFVDQTAFKLGRVGKRFRVGAQWLVARAGEEAEDIWAEAQEIRRSNRQG